MHSLQLRGLLFLDFTLYSYVTQQAITLLSVSRHSRPILETKLVYPKSPKTQEVECHTS